MTKTELVRAVQERTGLSSRQKTLKAVDAIVASLFEKLARGESVVFKGFGTFSITRRSEHRARNIRTGRTFKVAARNAVKFSPAKTLREDVRALKER